MPPIPLKHARMTWEIPAQAGSFIHIEMATDLKESPTNTVTLTLLGPRGGFRGISVIRIQDLLITITEILEAEKILTTKE